MQFILKNLTGKIVNRHSRGVFRISHYSQSKSAPLWQERLFSHKNFLIPSV